MSKVKYDTENHGKDGGDNFGEGNLDVKMIASFGLGVETLVSNTNTSASTEEGDGFGQALLDFITELSSRQTVPQVLSMSLGSLSATSCNLLCSEATKMGHSLEECHAYMQRQRQVCMFLSQEQEDRINTAFQVLGLRGVSIFGSSGDGGSHFSFGKFEGGALAKTLDKISCKLQMPVFPTTSPFIVSIGGTMWEGHSRPRKPVTWAGFGGGSGGGFSWHFDMPDHQKAAVAAYLANTSGLPPPSSFNAKGRAYPDISAIAVQGTSQSCPIMAGIFSMITDARLNANLPPLGFVAPRIWKVAMQFPGKVFQDISKGNSKTSCDNGFPSVAKSWDANTGWGSPIWAGMMDHFASDEDIGTQASAVVSIVV
jgi:tripeptidyl-peptidase-1